MFTKDLNNIIVSYLNYVTDQYILDVINADKKQWYNNSNIYNVISTENGIHIKTYYMNGIIHRETINGKMLPSRIINHQYYIAYEWYKNGVLHCDQENNRTRQVIYHDGKIYTWYKNGLINDRDSNGKLLHARETIEDGMKLKEWFIHGKFLDESLEYGSPLHFNKYQFILLLLILYFIFKNI